MEEHWKTILQEFEAHTKALKTFQDEMDDLKKALRDTFQRTMQVILGVRDRVVEQVKNFCLDDIILAKALDPFKSAPEVTWEDDISTLVP